MTNVANSARDRDDNSTNWNKNISTDLVQWHIVPTSCRELELLASSETIDLSGAKLLLELLCNIEDYGYMETIHH